MTRAEQIAAVLAEHRMMGTNDTNAICLADGCGWADDAGMDWNAHVAAALAAQETAACKHLPIYKDCPTQEGERGGAEVAAAVEAVLAGVGSCGGLTVDASGCYAADAASAVRAALADSAGALAKVKAEVLREVEEWANQYGHTSIPRIAVVQYVRERADRIEAPS